MIIQRSVPLYTQKRPPGFLSLHSAQSDDETSELCAKSSQVKSIYFIKPSWGNKEKRKEKSTKPCTEKSRNITTKQRMFTQIHFHHCMNQWLFVCKISKSLTCHMIYLETTPFAPKRHPGFLHTPDIQTYTVNEPFESYVVSTNKINVDFPSVKYVARSRKPHCSRNLAKVDEEVRQRFRSWFFSHVCLSLVKKTTMS